MNEICIVRTGGATNTPTVDSKLLLSLIFSLNVRVFIFFFTTMDYINTLHVYYSCLYLKKKREEI